MKVRILAAETEAVVDAATRILQGEVVSFPTETVYGLGGNALDQDSILRIFRVKGRPLNDPVICHVLNWERAAPLFAATKAESEVLQALATQFWPGPLSLVATAAACVPSVVTAGTGRVAVRCPQHPAALALLKKSNVPIAAPSANRFGHISPSTPEHVAADFESVQFPMQPDLLVLDGGPCTVGIESTVCSVTELMDDLHSGARIEIVILRRGFVTADNIKKVLSARSFVFSWDVTVAVPEHQGSKTENQQSNVEDPHSAPHSSEHHDGSRKVQITSAEPAQLYESPGMLLSHYAPIVPAYLVRHPDYILASDSVSDNKDVNVRNIIVLDAFQRLTKLRLEVRGYRSLTESDSVATVENVANLQRTLFEALRWAESVALSHDCSAIYIADFYDDAAEFGEALLAVYDRVYRCVELLGAVPEKNICYICVAFRQNNVFCDLNDTASYFSLSLWPHFNDCMLILPLLFRVAFRSAAGRRIPKSGTTRVHQ